MHEDSSPYIDSISNVVIALTLFLFPLFFLLNTTDFFILPKQILIIASTIILLVLLSIKILLNRKLVLNASPLNLPLIIFGLIVLVSSLLAANRFDSLIQATPIIFGVLFSFLIINNVKTKEAFSFVFSALILGATAGALITIAYYFKIYFLPFPSIQTQSFNTFGSILQELIYLLPLLVFSIIYSARKFGFPKIRIPTDLKNDPGFFIQFFSGIILFLTLALIFYQMFLLSNKPVVLPYLYGFQTAAASISQDVKRFIVSLLFGSGYGTFIIDFTKYKLPSFNLEPNIWNLTFSYSSSYFLELLATTGLLGAISYIFLIVSFIKTRVPKNPLFVAVASMLILSIILPFGYATIGELLVLIAIYVAYLNISGDRRVYDIILTLIASKNGMFSFETLPDNSKSQRSESPVLSGVVLLIIILFVGFFGFYSYKFVSSDMKFAESLKQASLNNGQKTYQLQSQAIADFPYRSDYYRIFSQVNLAIANSLATGLSQDKTQNPKLQQDVLALLQQSINSARSSIALAPQNSLNWQNLGNIYRSLINVGQNADQFSIASINQAISLDPYNPQLYIQLGGIYYQQKQWDAAQNQFQIAINLKRDFANGYYNLGHVLEEKGDLEGAIANYQIVKQLSSGNKNNLDKISEEIKALEGKIGQAKKEGSNIKSQTQQTPLSVSSSSTTQFPPQEPQIKISPPPVEATTSAK